MLNEPRCPECKIEIDTEEVFDIDNQGYKIITYELGTCSKCGKEYMWRCTYNYEGCSFLVETNKGGE